MNSSLFLACCVEVVSRGGSSSCAKEWFGTKVDSSPKRVLKKNNEDGPSVANAIAQRPRLPLDCLFVLFREKGVPELGHVPFVCG